MTHAQVAMDASVHKKWIEGKPEPSTWQLKRFRENIEPRTSTKRGDVPFMSKTSKSPE
jgi:hypothetical protein